MAQKKGAQMTAPTVQLMVELSPVGVARARLDLDQIEAIVSPAKKTTAAATPATTGSPALSDVVTVYKHARTIPDSRTPELLELFAREPLLSPAEVGVELGNGQPLTKAQGRAFIRNLSRMEGHLVEQGRISHRVLLKDFSTYDADGCGKYGFSDEDRAALRNHLGLQ
jgi:hypothetical protein